MIAQCDVLVVIVFMVSGFARNKLTFFNFSIYLQSVTIHSANGVLGSEGG
jgi:hypothetical protein